PGRVALAVDDLAAELGEALVEGLDDVLEVDEERVRREGRGLPAAPVCVLRHRRALVLRDVPEAERELALRAEALRPHLVGADAGRDREDAAIDRLLDNRRREVDVAGREDDVRAGPEQAGGARLGLRRVVVLGVAGLDLELPSAEGAALGVDLRDA